MFIISLGGIMSGLYLLRPEVEDDAAVNEFLETSEMEQLTKIAEEEGVDAVRSSSSSTISGTSQRTSRASRAGSRAKKLKARRSSMAPRASAYAPQQNAVRFAPPSRRPSASERPPNNNANGNSNKIPLQGRAKAKSRATALLKDLGNIVESAVTMEQVDSTGARRVPRMSLASSYTQAALKAEREDAKYLESGDKRRRSSIFMGTDGKVAFNGMELGGALATIESVRNLNGDEDDDEEIGYNAIEIRTLDTAI